MINKNTVRARECPPLKVFLSTLEFRIDVDNENNVMLTIPLKKKKTYFFFTNAHGILINHLLKEP